MGGSALGLEILVTTTCIKYRHGRASGRDELITWDVFGPMSGNLVEVKVEGELKSAKLVDIGTSSLVVWPLVDSFSNKFMDLYYGWRVHNPRFSPARLDFAVSISDVPAFHQRTFYYMPWQGYQTHSEDVDSTPSQESYSRLPQFLLFELVDVNMGRFRRIGTFYTMADYEAEYNGPQPNEAEFPCWAYNKETGKHTIYII